MPDFASTHRQGSSQITQAPASNVRNDQLAGHRPIDRMEDEEDDAIPPPTPAVQFYAPTQALLNGSFHPRPALPSNGTASFAKHQDMHAPPTGEMTSASSSSSLSSMTATLVGGGPGYPPVHAPHQYVPHSHGHEQHGHTAHMQTQLAGLRPSLSTGSLGSHPSPISPAALIGQVHGENLMLPPPRQGQSPLQQYHGGGQQSMSDQQQRHLAWLRDLNAMAKAATLQTHPRQDQASQREGAPASPPKQVSFQQLLPEGMIFPPDFNIPLENKPPPVETAEKRAKRLERNRESARKSRRRKKERLLALEAQVNTLHGRIEAERRTQINAMVSKLRKCRVAELARVVPDLNAMKAPGGMSFVIQTTGPSNDIVRSVQDFQHNLLKQTVLPRYHKLLFWLTVQSETFFIAGKEDYINRINRLNRSVAKISSKQIGDELTNGVKEIDENDDEESAPAHGTKRVTFQDTSKKEAAGEPLPSLNLTTYANDAARVWPLLCYEIGLGVDQEEKFVSLHKRAQGDGMTPVGYPQLTAAVVSTDSLQEATESLSHVISQREALSFVSILSPAQVLAYQTWLASNRGRCTALVANRDTTPNVSIDSSLHDICRRLNHVMRISMYEK